MSNTHSRPSQRFPVPLLLTCSSLLCFRAIPALLSKPTFQDYVCGSNVSPLTRPTFPPGVDSHSLYLSLLIRPRSAPPPISMTAPPLPPARFCSRHPPILGPRIISSESRYFSVLRSLTGDGTFLFGLPLPIHFLPKLFLLSIFDSKTAKSLLFSSYSFFYLIS